MKKANKFYDWFLNLGGNMVHIDVSIIVLKLNNPIFNISSFKNRGQEIKDKYNYRFTYGN